MSEISIRPAALADDSALAALDHTTWAEPLSAVLAAFGAGAPRALRTAAPDTVRRLVVGVGTGVLAACRAGLAG